MDIHFFRGRESFSFNMSFKGLSAFTNVKSRLTEQPAGLFSSQLNILNTGFLRHFRFACEKRQCVKNTGFWKQKLLVWHSSPVLPRLPWFSFDLWLWHFLDLSWTIVKYNLRLRFAQNNSGEVTLSIHWHKKLSDTNYCPKLVGCEYRMGAGMAERCKQC